MPEWTDEQIERATMALLNHAENMAPHVDWHAARDMRVSRWRERVRAALDAATSEE